MAEVSKDLVADFGATLRRLRLARGLSLGQLAASVHYSTGHLSHIEHGRKRPSETLARLCDGALDAGGELVGHPAVAADAATEPGSAPPTLAAFAHTPWVLRVTPDGSGSWEAGGVHRPLRTGAVGGVAEQWALFDALRGLGRTTSPAAVLPMTSTFFASVRSAARSSVGGARRQQMLLGARLAEYLGWLWQEAGDDTAALSWTDSAVELAREADDTDLSEYAGARRALVMLYRRDAAGVVALTEAVAGTASPRVRWLSALREAQGHALAGDHARCMRALDRARALTDAVATAQEPAVLGPASPGDRVAAVTGWCLYDLGRPAHAIAALRKAIATMPPHTREYPRFGVRLALSCVAAGDVARGCAVMDEVLDTVVRVDSATIRTDLGAFARLIERHHRDAEAARLRQRLTAALHPGP